MWESRLIGTELVADDTRVRTDLEKSWKTLGILKKCNLSLNCPGILKKCA